MFAAHEMAPGAANTSVRAHRPRRTRVTRPAPNGERPAVSGNGPRSTDLAAPGVPRPSSRDQDPLAVPTEGRPRAHGSARPAHGSAAPHQPDVDSAGIGSASSRSPTDRRPWLSSAPSRHRKSKNRHSIPCHPAILRRSVRTPTWHASALARSASTRRSNREGGVLLPARQPERVRAASRQIRLGRSRLRRPCV